MLSCYSEIAVTCSENYRSERGNINTEKQDEVIIDYRKHADYRKMFCKTLRYELHLTYDTLKHGCQNAAPGAESAQSSSLEDCFAKF